MISRALLAAFVVVSLGCEDEKPPLGAIEVLSLEGGPELLEVQFALQTVAGQPTKRTGGVVVQVVGAPAGASDAALDEGRGMGHATGYVDESGFTGAPSYRARVSARLPPSFEPLPGEEIYVRVRFEPSGGEAPATPWVTVETPASLTRDGIAQTERERLQRRAEAQVPATAAQAEKEEVLRAYIASIARAVDAVPQGGDDVPTCDRSDPADTRSRRGRFLWEDWGRRVAAAEEPATLPNCPRQEEREHSFVDRVLCDVVSLTRRVASDRADVYRSSDRVAERAEQLAQDGPWLRVLRITQFVDPVVGARNDQGTNFTPGHLGVRVFVVDRAAGTLVCRADVSATNTPRVRMQHDGRDDLRGDLVGQLWEALLPATPLSPSGE